MLKCVECNKRKSYKVCQKQTLNNTEGACQQNFSVDIHLCFAVYEK